MKKVAKERASCSKGEIVSPDAPPIVCSKTSRLSASNSWPVTVGGSFKKDKSAAGPSAWGWEASFPGKKSQTATIITPITTIAPTIKIIIFVRDESIKYYLFIVILNEVKD